MTGAASGIGAACAQRLAADGARVVLLDRDERVARRGRAARRDGVVADLTDTVAVRGARAGRGHRGQLRRHPARRADRGLPAGAVPPDPHAHGRGPVPHPAHRPAGHVRQGLGPRRAHLLGARDPRLGVQERVRRGEARHRGTVEDAGAGRRPARRHLQHRLPRVRADAAGGEPDRRPGPHARHRRGRGGREDHADRAGDQAADRAGRGGRARSPTCARTAASFVNGSSLVLDGGWSAR